MLAACLAVPLTAAGDGDIWHKAESAHFTIYSSGDREDLVEFTRELEKFDGLLRFWFQKPDRGFADKIDIYLLRNQKQVASLIDHRSTVAGYYSSRVEGTYAVAHYKRGGRRDLTGQRVLFHEYAHHFMFSEFDKPVPAWLIEGFAEFLGATEFNDDGTWTFGKPASHRGRELRYYNDPQIERLFKWPDEEEKIITGFYGWSWALTHMLYTAPDQGARISAYVDRLAAGEEPLPAAEAVFGNLTKLQGELRTHVRRKIEYSVSDQQFPWADSVDVIPLSADESLLVELRLRRLGGADVEDVIADLATYSTQTDLKADALTELAHALRLGEAQARAKKRAEDEKEGRSTDYPYEPWFIEAEKVVDRALEADPEHVEANILKGTILLGRLDARSEEEAVEADEWKAARRYLQRANRADPANTEALYRLANSYAQQEVENGFMYDAFGAAYLRAPQTRPFRISLAYDLARQGRYDEGLALLQMLANDPHYPDLGRKAVERIEMMRETGAKFPPELPDEDEDETAES
jgi:hypothetical protein